MTVLPPGALPLPASPPWLLHLLPQGLTQPLPGEAVHSGPSVQARDPGSTLCRQWAFLHLFCSSVLLDTKCLVNSCSPADFSHP